MEQKSLLAVNVLLMPHLVFIAAVDMGASIQLFSHQMLQCNVTMLGGVCEDQWSPVSGKCCRGNVETQFAVAMSVARSGQLIRAL